MAKHYENMQVYGDIDVRNAGQIKNLKTEKLATLPTFDSAEEGRQVYLTTDKTLYYNDGIAWKAIGSGSGSVARTLIYITDIVPVSTGQVFNKVYDSANLALATCKSDTSSVKVRFTTQTGNISGLIPTVSVNGTNAILTNSSPGVWTGEANITMSSTGNVAITHQDGTVYTSVLTLEVGPTIVSAIIQGYPSGQTELKAGDVVSVTVTSNQALTEINFVNSGLVANTATTVSVANLFTTTVSATIADRGTSVQSLGILLRGKNVNGSYGAQYNTSTGGAVDGVNVVKLNNLLPTITFTSITYPATQGALKNSEVATVNHTASNYNSISYTSPNGDLTITAPTTYNTAKTVTRLAGSYNVSTTNFRIMATRTANAGVTVYNGVVKIANVAPTVTASTATARLRSGGNQGTTIQNHTITLTSNQEMPSAMSVTAPAGTFTGSWTGTQVSTRTLQVHDNDDKGTFSFADLSATNLAGITQSTITSPSYTIGGFVLRTLTVGSLSRETDIGTSVENTAKLRCSNLSKGLSGSLNFTFVNNVGNAVDTYTITSPSETYNANGDIWYNRDELNAISNTTGTMIIELEELI